MKIFDFQE